MHAVSPSSSTGWIPATRFSYIMLTIRAATANLTPSSFLVVFTNTIAFTFDAGLLLSPMRTDLRPFAELAHILVFVMDANC